MMEVSCRSPLWAPVMKCAWSGVPLVELGVVKTLGVADPVLRFFPAVEILDVALLGHGAGVVRVVVVAAGGWIPSRL